MENKTRSTDELYKQLRSMQRKYKISLWLFLICAVAAVVLFITKGAWGFAPIVPAIPAVIYLTGVQKKYKKLFKDEVVEAVIAKCDFIDNIYYDADGGIAECVVVGSGMLHSCDRYSASDFISGTYKGVNFEQSDIHLESTTSDADNTSSSSTMLRGRWMTYFARNKLPCKMQVVSKGFYADRGGKMKFIGEKHPLPEVEEQDKEFSKKFKIYAADVQTGGEAVTRAFKDSLDALREKLGHPFMLSFEGNCVYLAVGGNVDSFEPKFSGKLDPEKEDERIMSEVKMITCFIDAMQDYLA